MPLRRRLLLVSLTSLILALPVGSLLRNDAASCGTVGDCLNNALALLGYTLALPLLAWAALRLLKVPAPLVHAVLAWLVGLVLYAVGSALATASAAPAPFGDRPLLGWPWILLIGAAAGAIAAPLASPVLPGQRPGRHAALTYAGVAVAMFAVVIGSRVLAADALDRAHREAVVTTGLTAYLPEFPGTQPGRAIAQDGSIRIWYDRTGAGQQAITVQLLRTPTDLCSTLTIPDTVSRRSCRVTDTPAGRVMRAPYAEYVHVAVVRGETTLVVESVDTRTVDANQVVAALSSAPRVSLEELADRYHPQY